MNLIYYFLTISLPRKATLNMHIQIYIYTHAQTHIYIYSVTYHAHILTQIVNTKSST